MTQQTINERIKILIDELGVKSVNEFAKQIGHNTHEKIARLLRDYTKKPSYDIINDILLTFSQVNPEWLVNGRGYMFKNPDHFSAAGDRIGRIMEVYGLSVGEFADKVGQHPVLIHEIINNDKLKMGQDLFVSILEVYPDIRPRWLLYNEQPMMRDKKETPQNEIPIEAKSGDTITLTIHLK